MKNWDLFSWLEPKGESCMICNGRRLQTLVSNRLEKGLLRKLSNYLCMSCFIEIAWIDQVFCIHCGRNRRCMDCQQRRTPELSVNRSAVAYDEVMKEWIHRYKFQGDEKLSELLGLMLLPAVERVSAQLICSYRLVHAWRTSGQSPLAWLKKSKAIYWDAVTAVPISEERYRERGFNQAYQLAQVISKEIGVPYIELLKRTTHEAWQSHLGREARFQGLEDRYRSCTLGWNELLRYVGKRERLHILIIDDVYTTGSTLHTCARVMKTHSPIPLTVASVTWARS